MHILLIVLLIVGIISFGPTIVTLIGLFIYNQSYNALREVRKDFNNPEWPKGIGK